MNLLWIVLFIAACAPSAAATLPSATATLTSLPMITNGPQSFPVEGSVVLEEGRCCVGGPEGQPVDIRAGFEASSPFGEVSEMRTAEHCITEDEMVAIAWEPFAASKVFQFTPPVSNWFSFWSAVQYKDSEGNLSPVYCDDIGVEGMPVTPAP